MKTSINKKTLRFMIVTIGLIVMGLLTISFISVGKMRLDTIGRRQKQVALIFSEFIAHQIDHQVGDIRTFIGSPWWRDAVKEANFVYENWEPKAIREHMARMDEQWVAMADSPLQEWLDSRMGQRLKILAAQDETVAEIFLTDQYGGLVAASGKTSDFYQADEKWWQHAYNNGKGDIYFGEVELDESSGKISSALAVPIKNEADQIIGIAKAVLDIGIFFHEMKLYKFGKTGHSALVDEQGRVIYYTGREPMSASPLSRIMIKEFSRGKHDFMVVDLGRPEGRSLVSVTKVKSQFLEGNGIHWVSVVSQGMNEIFLPIYMVLGIGLILTLFVSFLVITIIQRSIKGIFISPLLKIRDGMQRFSDGEKDYKIDLNTGDEIEDLADAFNKMTMKLEKTTISKDYLDNIMASMADSLIVIDPDTKIAIVNKATCAILGYKEEELIGKDMNLLFQTEDFFEGIKLQKLFKEEEVLRNFEVDYKTKDGKIIPVILSGAILKRNDCPQGMPRDDCPSFKEKGEHCEKILGAVCVAKDVSERKKSDEERERTLQWQKDINMLQQSLLASGTLNDKLKSITEGIVHIFRVDLCRIWLIGQGDLCEQGCIHAEVKEGPHVCLYRDKCLHLMASSGRHAHINGKDTNVRIPLGCYEIGRIALNEEHGFLTNDVANDSRVYDREWARELGLVSFAGYQLRITGGEMIGVLILFAKYPILQTEDAMIDTLSNATAFVVQEFFSKESIKKQALELDVLLKESIKSHEILSSMLADNNQVRERLEESVKKLKETQALLIHAEKMEAVGRMASSVAHEVKNPLGIVLQGINYFEGELPLEKKDDREMLGMMKDSVKRADNIVRTLLDFSRSQELKKELQDINAIIENSFKLVQHNFKLHSVELVCEAKKDLPKILLDIEKIEQVFINLFNNAVDAMPKGGKLYVRSYLSELKEPKNKIGNRENDVFKLGEKVIVVEVEDTGMGIGEDNIAKIFDPFFTTKGRTEGTGLGLSVVKSIVEMHRGLIEVESKKGKGTKITLIFSTPETGRY
jgi:PAS domain S-box-containing protein